MKREGVNEKEEREDEKREGVNVIQKFQVHSKKFCWFYCIDLKKIKCNIKFSGERMKEQI